MDTRSLSGFTREDTRILKALAVLLMMVHHLFAYPERMGEGVFYISLLQIGGQNVEYGLGQFGNICVALFALLGGYGTWHSCRGGSRLIPILLKKVKGMYLCYWQVFAVFVPLCLLLGRGPVTWNLKDMLWNVTGLHVFYNAEWWFFTPYVFLLLGYPLLHRISGWFPSFWMEMLPVLAVRFLLAPGMPEGGWPLPQLSQAAVLLCSFWMGVILAKYGILSAVKEKTRDRVWWNIAGWAGAAGALVMRLTLGEPFDFLTAALLAAAVTAALNCALGRLLQKLLLPIGRESTCCWLVHSFYCYHLCQKLVFAPRYSVLIVLWLAVLCYGTARILRRLYSCFDGCILKQYQLK